MTTDVERQPPGPGVEELIRRFTRATSARELEIIADHLGAARDRRAIRPLLMSLSNCHVQEDPDVEDAVCRALVELDVMRCSGNLSLSLQPRQALAADVADTIRELAGMIPWRYFGTTSKDAQQMR